MSHRVRFFGDDRGPWPKREGWRVVAVAAVVSCDAGATLGNCAGCFFPTATFSSVDASTPATLYVSRHTDPTPEPGGAVDPPVWDDVKRPPGEATAGPSAPSATAANSTPASYGPNDASAAVSEAPTPEPAEASVPVPGVAVDSGALDSQATIDGSPPGAAYVPFMIGLTVQAASTAAPVPERKPPARLR